MKKDTKKKKQPSEKPMKPIFAIGNIVYTVGIFGVITVLMAALPRSTKSDIEQRNLAQFPEFSWESFLNGSYTNGITEYYDDTVPYRDTIKKAIANIQGLYGIEFENAEFHGQLAVVTEESDDEETAPAETTTAAAETTTEVQTTAAESTASVETEPAATTVTAASTTEPPSTEKNVNEIADGVITNGQVVTKLSDGHWWGISLFGGGKGKVYADALNRFRKELGEDINIYSMIVPTSGEYYLPESYAQYNASHRKSVDSVNSQLDSSIIPVNAIGELWNHINEPIYTRTDHHWQPLGAYYAAKTFAAAAGVPFADISTYKKVSIDGYMGTMYSYTQSANLLNDPETFVYYKPSNDYTTYYYNTSYGFDYKFPLFVEMPVNSSYSTFMGGDAKIVRIKTDVNNGRKLLLFKDSYGNAEVPFYTGSFEEIYVCDMRYFDLNAVQFIKEKKITDLLFTMCTFSAVGTNANGLNKVLDNPVKEIIDEVE